MNHQLYILGLLLRFGPQHGYLLFEKIEKELSDFTNIKMPSLYYHLGKLEEKGFVTMHQEKIQARPDRSVYTISEKGKEEFQHLLKNTLGTYIDPVVRYEEIFYFADFIGDEALIPFLNKRIKHLEKRLAAINNNIKEAIKHIPVSQRKYALIIFNRHIYDTKSEIDFAHNSLILMKEEDAKA